MQHDSAQGIADFMGHTGGQASKQGKVLGAPGRVFQAALLGFRMLARSDFVAEDFVNTLSYRKRPLYLGQARQMQVPPVLHVFFYPLCGEP
jgi:hypothetical protein